MQRCLFDLHADRETLRRREESTAVSPQHRFPCSPFVASTHHPPPPCRAHTWAVDESREWRTVQGQSGGSVDSSLVRHELHRVSEQLAPSCRVRRVTLRSKLVLGPPFLSCWNVPALLFSLALTYPITTHNGIWIFPGETYSSSCSSLMFQTSCGGTDDWVSCYISLTIIIQVTKIDAFFPQKISRIRKSQLSFLKPRLNLCWTLIKSGIDCSNEVVPPLTTRWSANNANLDWHLF